VSPAERPRTRPLGSLPARSEANGIPEGAERVPADPAEGDAQKERRRALERLKAEPPTRHAQVEADALRRQAEDALRAPADH
jgi:hypothetical protein